MVNQLCISEIKGSGNMPVTIMPVVGHLTLYQILSTIFRLT